jgi:hypothetical protein
MHARQLLLLSAFVAVSTAAYAGEASGEFQTGTHPPIRPKYAAAYETHDPRDARKRAIEVVLSDKPIDAAAAVAALDPHTHVINQDALEDTNYILLWIRPDGDASMNATYSANMTQYVDATSMGKLKADWTANTRDLVAGHLTSTRDTYKTNLTFSTAVTRRAPGEKLGPGGGPAGKALLALLAAVEKKNWDAIQANVTREFDDVDDAVQTLGFWLPKKRVKITGGELRGDTAILDVEGEIFAGQLGLYLVRMVKNEKGWRFDEATKAGLID